MCNLKKLIDIWLNPTEYVVKSYPNHTQRIKNIKKNTENPYVIWDIVIEINGGGSFGATCDYLFTSAVQKIGTRK